MWLKQSRVESSVWVVIRANHEVSSDLACISLLLSAAMEPKVLSSH